MIKITDPKVPRNYIPRSISNYNFEMFKNGHKRILKEYLCEYKKHFEKNYVCLYYDEEDIKNRFEFKTSLVNGIKTKYLVRYVKFPFEDSIKKKEYLFKRNWY